MMALPMAYLRIPYLRVPCFVHGSEVRFASGLQDALDADSLVVLESVFEGGVTTDELARRLGGSEPAKDMEARVAALSASFRDPLSLIGEVGLEVPDDPDIILVEQGYGGVYVHTVEMLKQLRRRWSCLLLSPVEPLFETTPMPEVLTLHGLRRQYAELSYLAWVQIIRTIVKCTNCRLLMIMHRSQSLLLFDLLHARRTVIYCDGFYDAAFRRVQDFHLDESPERRREVLGELYYLLGNSAPGFYGISASPSVNVKLLMAGGYSLTAAVENWCWGREQHKQFLAAFPALRGSIRLVLPFINPDLFDPTRIARSECVLFTTTMHNIDKKGLPELVRAMQRLPSMRVRCVVRQPHRLPSIPAQVKRRMEMGSVDKDAMVGLYHSMWLNCRVSRQESSPLSILESMVCELPQIVSTEVANQIPIIEDGATGFVIDPDDTERLVWALRTLLGNRRLRDRMGRECRRRAMELALDRRIGEFERLLA
jgi:glycosyltransferase involved in cell wall biosynthesis